MGLKRSEAPWATANPPLAEICPELLPFTFMVDGAPGVQVEHDPQDIEDVDVRLTAEVHQDGWRLASLTMHVQDERDELVCSAYFDDGVDEAFAAIDVPLAWWESDSGWALRQFGSVTRLLGFRVRHQALVMRDVALSATLAYLAWREDPDPVAALSLEDLLHGASGLPGLQTAIGPTAAESCLP